MKLKRVIPFHPFLVASHILLHLWAFNAAEFPYYQHKFLILVALNLIVAVLWLLLFLITRNIHRAAFLTSLLWLFFSSYGHILILFRNHLFALRERELLSVYAVLILPILLISYIKRRSYLRLSTFMNIFSVILILLPISKITYHHLTKSVNYEMLSEKRKPMDIVFQAEEKPDIYFIVLDEYARADFLKSYFDYDNSDFIHELEALGFFVSKISHSSYIHSEQSLASTLNMRYLNFIEDTFGDQNIPFLGILAQMIADNRVAHILIENGYRYILFDSGWYATSNSPLADEVISNTLGDLLQYTLIETTIARLFMKEFGTKNIRAKHLHALKRLTTLSKSAKSPKFVFAHFLLPHSPFVFGKNGEIPKNPAKRKSKEQSEEEYKNQLIYTNKLILKALKTLLKNSKKKPIILLSSDHGFRPEDVWNASLDYMQIATASLAAFYMPGVDPSELEKLDHFTPVNTFRFLFDTYFKTNLGLLDDHGYYFPESLDCEDEEEELSEAGIKECVQNMFKFTEVTDLIHEIT